jgi:hypothetical protein
VLQSDRAGAANQGEQIEAFEFTIVERPAKPALEILAQMPAGVSGQGVELADLKRIVLGGTLLRQFPSDVQLTLGAIRAVLGAEIDDGKARRVVRSDRGDLAAVPLER